MEKETNRQDNKRHWLYETYIKKKIGMKLKSNIGNKNLKVVTVQQVLAFLHRNCVAATSLY